ncbi:MAG: hypothetical protein JSW41_03805 [Candidatus Aenigmatarchaeota archaeon]|nr:MAG: hypothetical protein JSW41_03805 [Candidatus Aenigmarchaeota archaeon]
MVKQGFKGITIKEEYFDMAKILAEAKSLGLGRSVASIVERSIAHLITEVQDTYRMMYEKSFYQALKEYQQEKKKEEAREG